MILMDSVEKPWLKPMEKHGKTLAKPMEKHGKTIYERRKTRPIPLVSSACRASD